jgi:hypothetical protein
MIKFGLFCSHSFLSDAFFHLNVDFSIRNIFVSCMFSSVKLLLITVIANTLIKHYVSGTILNYLHKKVHLVFII